MTVQETEHPAVDVLRVLAISRSSGALEVRGAPGGAFFLHEGEVTYAETLGVPPIPESGGSDPELPSMIRSTILEAGVEMLSGPQTAAERPLFRPGRRHWTGLRCRMAVEHLLAEISDLISSFARHGVRPDDEIRLCWLPRGRNVVIDAQQWAITGRLTGAQSPRTLARRSGLPLTATLTSIAALISAGVAKLVSHETDGADASSSAPPASGSIPAASTATAAGTNAADSERAASATSILTASKPIVAPPGPERLPRRRPRSIEVGENDEQSERTTPTTGTRPVAPDPGPAVPAPANARPVGSSPGFAADLDPDSRVAIAMRVLEGLKRL